MHPRGGRRPGAGTLLVTQDRALAPLRGGGSPGHHVCSREVPACLTHPSANAQQHWVRAGGWAGTPEGGARAGGWGAGPGSPLTGGASVEVVIVLGHVGQDAQAVGHPQRHHVLGIQQSRDAQLLLSHTEGLGGGGQQGRRGTLPLPPPQPGHQLLLGGAPRQQTRSTPRKVWVQGSCSAYLASVYPSVHRTHTPDTGLGEGTCGYLVAAAEAVHQSRGAPATCSQTPVPWHR